MSNPLTVNALFSRLHPTGTISYVHFIESRYALAGKKVQLCLHTFFLMLMRRHEARVGDI